MNPAYDAILIVSFGGPEGPDEVMPFLDNVLRGRNVPEARKLAVAEHYYHFGGISPLNQQNRELIAALRAELDEAGIDLPLYWGNRNWHPLLTDTLRLMGDAGIRRVLALFTSAYSSYSGCRQYRENLQDARTTAGRPDMVVDKIRVFFNHPGFIEANTNHIRAAMTSLPTLDKSHTALVFTAHSIPLSMAQGCAYQKQLRQACKLVTAALVWDDWDLVYQSRSGPPHQPWLEPDILDHLRRLHEAGTQAVVISPIGFISDHLEILFDLDTEARELCQELGMTMALAKTAGAHPAFVAMIRELIEERLGLRVDRRALGQLGPWHDVCPENCCLPTSMK